MTINRLVDENIYMDERSKERLQNILKKEIVELNSDEKKFIKARASYLSKTDREKYAEIINASSQDLTPSFPQPNETQEETSTTFPGDTNQTDETDGDEE